MGERITEVRSSSNKAKEQDENEINFTLTHLDLHDALINPTGTIMLLD